MREISIFYVHRITSRFPDDPRQPFWDEEGTPMKPLAKLTLTRQRLYKKSCGLDDVPFQESTEFYDTDHGNSFILSLANTLNHIRHSFPHYRETREERVRKFCTYLVHILYILSKYLVKRYAFGPYMTFLVFIKKSRNFLSNCL